MRDGPKHTSKNRFSQNFKILMEKFFFMVNFGHKTYKMTSKNFLAFFFFFCKTAKKAPKSLKTAPKPSWRCFGAFLAESKIKNMDWKSCKPTWKVVLHHFLIIKPKNEFLDFGENAKFGAFENHDWNTEIKFKSKIKTPDAGFEPATYGPVVWRLPSCAIGAVWCPSTKIYITKLNFLSFRSMSTVREKLFSKMFLVASWLDMLKRNFF